MRILLIHNPKAGDRKHTKKQLMTSLTRCGHQAFYQSISERGWKRAFRKPVDLIIAAGGDGTGVGGNGGGFEGFGGFGQGGQSFDFGDMGLGDIFSSFFGGGRSDEAA